MKKTKPEFSFGNITNDETAHSGKTRTEFLKHEIFELNCYEKIFPVQEGDVVLDLGASVGPFTWKIMDKASKVYTVEPMIDLIPTITDNVKGFDVTIINKLLSHENGEVEFTDACINTFEPKIVETMTFKSFLEDNNVDKIDFIKTDCESGEYALISNENIGWIKKNVRNIVGEWHLDNFTDKAEFRYFRDKFLTQFKNYEVFALDDCDIKWDLQNDHFIDYYNQVIIHIEV